MKKDTVIETSIFSLGTCCSVKKDAGTEASMFSLGACRSVKKDTSIDGSMFSLGDRELPKKTPRTDPGQFLPPISRSSSFYVPEIQPWRPGAKRNIHSADSQFRQRAVSFNGYSLLKPIPEEPNAKSTSTTTNSQTIIPTHVTSGRSRSFSEPSRTKLLGKRLSSPRHSLCSSQAIEKDVFSSIRPTSSQRKERAFPEVSKTDSNLMKRLNEARFRAVSMKRSISESSSMNEKELR